MANQSQNETTLNGTIKLTRNRQIYRVSIEASFYRYNPLFDTPYFRNMHAPYLSLYTRRIAGHKP